MEGNFGRKAGDLIPLFGNYICEDGVRARRDLPGQIDILGQLHLALLEWTLKISLSNCVAAVCLLVDERDETVFDLEMHHEAFTDFFLEVACSGDGKFLARSGWVGAQIDLFNLEQVVCWITAEVQGVVARDLVLLLDYNLAVAPWSGCGAQSAQRSEDKRGELHRGGAVGPNELLKAPRELGVRVWLWWRLVVGVQCGEVERRCLVRVLAVREAW